MTHNSNSGVTAMRCSFVRTAVRPGEKFRRQAEVDISQRIQRKSIVAQCPKNALLEKCKSTAMHHEMTRCILVLLAERTATVLASTHYQKVLIKVHLGSV